ncbi:hypothetical protein NXC24_PC00425 (plasmid) [Rhizobium sp. NXC24]|nr:hypothetical protein NXC24_PC00425 [Rhizobium sp. NXC24]
MRPQRPTQRIELGDQRPRRPPFAHRLGIRKPPLHADTLSPKVLRGLATGPRPELDRPKSAPESLQIVENAVVREQNSGWPFLTEVSFIGH